MRVVDELDRLLRGQPAPTPAATVPAPFPDLGQGVRTTPPPVDPLLAQLTAVLGLR